MRALIAVPAYPMHPGRVEGWVDAAIAVPALYLEALQRAGAQEAVLMPVSIDAHEADELLARFDGLLLAGGGDLDPATYEHPARQEIYGVHAERDAFELALARAAVDRGMPTLAICRGLQVLNVALGGTLDQHILDRDGVSGHGLPGVEGGATTHPVTIEGGSRLAKAMDATRVDVSSHHHQAADELGDGLFAVSWSDDGIIEALDHDGDAWIVAVQWHPEDTAARDPAQQRLFDAFVSEASAHEGR